MGKPFIFVVFMLLPPAIFCQTKIDKSKKELTANDRVKSQANDRTSGNNDCDNIFEILFIKGLGSIFKYGLIGDYTREDHLTNTLTPYALYDGRVGNYENNPDSIAKKHFRIDIQDSFLYSDSGLFGNHMEAKIRPSRYFFVQADFDQLYELDDAADSYDKLSLFHFNVCYDRVRFEKFNFGWNIGIAYIGNEVMKGGFSYGLSAEGFMIRNFSISAAVNWSTINHKPVNTFEIGARYHIRKYFISVGLERLKIADPNYTFAGLGGGIYF